MEIRFLSILVFLPLIGVLLLACVPEFEAENMKKIALSTSVATFIWSLVVLGNFDFKTADFQMMETIQWGNAIGFSYVLGVDGLSIYLVMLTTILLPLCFLVSWNSIKKQLRLYLALFLILETFILGSFLSLNLVLFYVFFEGVLVPMYFLIGVWGGENRVYAAFKFFLYTMLGSVLMLVALMVIFTQLGSLNFLDGFTRVLSPDIQLLVWVCFFASFAVKVPMWPFHTWLPDAHVQAPTAASAVLAGVLLKMGGYGFLRFSLHYTPHISYEFMNWVFVLSVIAVVYTSLIALIQKDMKKLIAYSSVAHMGVVTMGIFSASLIGMSGAVFHMISHGLVSAALFICVGVLYERLHSYDVSKYGGVAKVMPLFSVGFMIYIFAAIGVPGTSGFIGELLVIFSSYQQHLVWALGVLIGLILSASYSLRLYRDVAFGPLKNKALEKVKDLDMREKGVFLSLAFLIIFLGFFPNTLLKPITLSMEKIHITWEKALEMEKGAHV